MLAINLQQNLDGTATIGEADVSGGSPSIKETMDGMYINDGYGGAAVSGEEVDPETVLPLFAEGATSGGRPDEAAGTEGREERIAPSAPSSRSTSARMV